MPPSKLRLSAGSISLSLPMTAFRGDDGAATASKGEGDPKHGREPHLGHRPPRLLHAPAGDALGALDPDFVESLLEQLPVLGVADYTYGGAEHPHAQAFEDAAFGQFQPAVEAGLAPEP